VRLAPLTKKIDIVRFILANKPCLAGPAGKGFAPTNIALCKYWGKRDTELNLPMTPSLSISLRDKGATTQIAEIAAPHDRITLNGQSVANTDGFCQRLTAFLDLFRPTAATCYQVDTQINIPVAAGLASSACGFAALVLALNELYEWRLSAGELSVLARLGSGSAARSLWSGFVEWYAGSSADGMDSHGVLLSERWPSLCVGLHLLSTGQKPISSREAMQRTVQTSQLYTAWPAQVRADMRTLKAAIAAQDFERLGQVAEANALAMHATMMSAWPPVIYSQPQTLSAMQQIWRLRADGVPVYFTQDAGPNLKLLFPESALPPIQSVFPDLILC
jgi:diphosphomevalonate decarboxylase